MLFAEKWYRDGSQNHAFRDIEAYRDGRNFKLYFEHPRTIFFEDPPPPRDRSGEVRDPKKWTFQFWTQKVDFLNLSPLNPPTKTPFLTHFVPAKSGVFDRFGGAYVASPHPLYGACQKVGEIKAAADLSWHQFFLVVVSRSLIIGLINPRSLINHNSNQRTNVWNISQFIIFSAIWTKLEKI